MNIMAFFGRRDDSASVAKNRLKILLEHERGGNSSSDAKLISSLREDIL
ncbi:MAG: cell division topological specificity factor MinE, partial [Roseibium sp.]